MLYISTRGAADGKTFADITFEGLARDGGLYVPENYPKFTADELAQLRGARLFKRCTRSPFAFLDAAAAEGSLAALPGRMAAIDLPQRAGYV